MSLFDSADDARTELESYLEGLGKDRKGEVVIQVVEQVCDTLRAVMILESSPFPIKSYVRDDKGAAHLKKVLTKTEHAAWLELVAKIQAAGFDEEGEPLDAKAEKIAAAKKAKQAAPKTGKKVSIEKQLQENHDYRVSNIARTIDKVQPA